MAAHGRGAGRGSRGRANNTSRGGRNNGGRGHGNYTNPSKPSKPKCQLCKKDGHMAGTCWYRFDEDLVIPEEKSANVASHGHGNYGVDSN